MCNLTTTSIIANVVKDDFALRLHTRGAARAAFRQLHGTATCRSLGVLLLLRTAGVRLLSGTTSAVVPTITDAAFLARIEPILTALDEAEHNVRERADFRRLLGMTMPTSFGIRDVIPRLASFARVSSMMQWTSP